MIIAGIAMGALVEISFYDGALIPDFSNDGKASWLKAARARFIGQPVPPPESMLSVTHSMKESVPYADFIRFAKTYTGNKAVREFAEEFVADQELKKALERYKETGDAEKFVAEIRRDPKFKQLLQEFASKRGFLDNAEAFANNPSISPVLSSGVIEDEIPEVAVIKRAARSGDSLSFINNKANPDRDSTVRKNPSVWGKTLSPFSSKRSRNQSATLGAKQKTNTMNPDGNSSGQTSLQATGSGVQKSRSRSRSGGISSGQNSANAGTNNSKNGMSRMSAIPEVGAGTEAKGYSNNGSGSGSATANQDLSSLQDLKIEAKTKANRFGNLGNRRAVGNNIPVDPCADPHSAACRQQREEVNRPDRF